MNGWRLRWLAAIVAAFAAVPAVAQRADEVAGLEPAVDTGLGPGAAASGPIAAPAAPDPDATALSLGMPPADPEAMPANPNAAGTAGAAPRATAAAPSSPRGAVIDRLDLGTTSITGNQELPKVLYIVPWKQSDLGDLIGRPVNTLLDEVLAPVDRRVFDRHLSYYEALHGESQEE